MADEIRRFDVGTPVVRISNASTNAVERIIVWSIFNNEYALIDSNWIPRHQAAPTEVDNGKIYTHIDGVRFHAAMTFNYWHEDYDMTPADFYAQSFTEHDYSWLLKAQVGTTYNIEFFPVDTIPFGTAPHAKYHVHILSLTRTRADDNAYVWNCSLEVEGINKVAAADIPVN